MSSCLVLPGAAVPGPRLYLILYPAVSFNPAPCPLAFPSVLAAHQALCFGGLERNGVHLPPASQPLWLWFSARLRLFHAALGARMQHDQEVCDAKK